MGKIFVLFVLILGIVGCGGGGTKSKKRTLTGIVWQGDPVSQAVVKVYRSNGVPIDVESLTDSSGKFVLNFTDPANIFIVKASGGIVNGQKYTEDLFAVCNGSKCNITPLSTIGHAYFSSLLIDDAQKRFRQMISDMVKILGLTPRDLNAIEHLDSVNIQNFQELVKRLGLDLVIAKVLNDMSDGYIDHFQTIFPVAKGRISQPVATHVESIKDADGRQIVLQVSGVDGSDMTEGYLVDTMATRKITGTNDDYQETEEDEVVYLGFHLGKYQDVINTETTVLAKLFMSDFELLLLPNSTKLELISKLQSQYKESYQRTIELYRFVIQNGKFYEPIFDKQLKQLVGYAQNILLQTNKNISPELRKLIERQKIAQHNVLLADSYQKLQRDKKTRDYILNGNLAIDYDQQNHNFKIKNNLPVYFGLRKSKNSYRTSELFTSPLIQPSELGAAGLMISGNEFLTSVLKYTLNKDAVKSTSLEGDQFDIEIFPFVGSDPVEGKKEYEFYKEFAFNMPTILNVSLGMKAVIELVSGKAAGKFKSIMDKLSDRAQNIKKHLKTIEDAIALADSLTEFIYVTIDTNIQNQDQSMQNTIRQVRQYFKSFNDEIKAANNIVHSVKNLIPPPSPYNVVIQDKAKMFLTKANVSEEKALENAAILKIIYYNSRGWIKNKDALKIIINGVIIGKVLEEFKKESLLYTKEGKALKNSLDKFESNYRTKLMDYSIFYVYNYVLNPTEEEKNTFLKSVSALKSPKLYKMEQDFRNLIVKAIVINKTFKGDIVTSVMENLLKPVNLAKMLVKIERMSVANVIKTTTDFIVDESVKIAGSAYKSFLSSAVKQVAYMFTGTKAIQAIGAGNEIIGIGYAIACTPSIVPFAVNVRDGKVNFDYPNIKVLAAQNSLIPVDAGKPSSVFMFLPQKSNDNSALIITSHDDYQALYDLSYRILFNNSSSTLKGIYNRWNTQEAIKAQISIRRYPDDDLSKEAITFNSKVNEVTWTISSDEAADAIKVYQNGSVIDIIDVLKKQNATGLKRLLCMSDDSSTVVQNRTRGIFNEHFEYKIYEPAESKLNGKYTKINYFDRKIFKVANVKELRQNIYLSPFDNNFNMITNLTGHKIVVIGRDLEQVLEDGESLKVLKSQKLRIVDAIVQQYGENINLHSTDSTLTYLINQKNSNVSYIANASEEGYWEPYQFILEVKPSDFTDQAPYTMLDVVNHKDYDGDNISDYDEMYVYYTNPYNADSDNDGINDWEEINTYYTNPYNADSDYDGVSDWQEINTYRTNPNSVDSDGDGIDDLNELIQYVDFVPEYNTIFGKVIMSDGTTPIANITVKFEYIKDGMNVSETDVTMPDGSYKIELSKEDFDNFKDDTKLVISAYADGYVPQIKEITKTDETNINVDFQLEPIKENEIVLEIEPHLHHLGDGHYTGSANSDFQRAGAEGQEFVKTFDIDANQFNYYQKAEITFEAKGVQNYSNKLYINNHAYSLQSSPYDGSYATQKISINKSEYSIGTNEIKITSGKNSYGDYDDFEFINIKITFTEPDEGNMTDYLVNAPGVEKLEADVSNPYKVVLKTTFYSGLSMTSIDKIYWKITSPTGKVHEDLYDPQELYTEGSATYNMQYSQLDVFDIDGTYKIESYVIDTVGRKSSTKVINQYIDIP